MKKKVGCCDRNSARVESSGEACLNMWAEGSRRWLSRKSASQSCKHKDCCMFSQHPCKSWEPLYLVPNAKGMVWWRQMNPSSLLVREPGWIDELQVKRETVSKNKGQEPQKERLSVGMWSSTHGQNTHTLGWAHPHGHGHTTKRGGGEKKRETNIQGTGKNFQKGSKSLGLACWTISGNCMEAVGASCWRTKHQTGWQELIYTGHGAHGRDIQYCSKYDRRHDNICLLWKPVL